MIQREIHCRHTLMTLMTLNSYETCNSPQPESAYPETSQMSNVRSCPGWNASHTQQTRFSAQLQANYTYIQASHASTINRLPEESIVKDQYHAMVVHIKNVHRLDVGSINCQYPCAFSTSLENKDTLNYGEMLQATNRPKFGTSMQSEVDGFCNILRVVLCSSPPEGVQWLPEVWSFKRKCLPDWLIIKWKAYLNVHGSQQQHGVNFWETYAPVDNWSTICLMLTISLLNNFKTCHINFIHLHRHL